MSTLPAQRISGLAHEADHPRRLIADLHAIRDRAGTSTRAAICYVGDGTLGEALLLAGAALGMDIRIAAPQALWPPDAMIRQAEDAAAQTGAQLLITSDAGHAVLGADYVIRGIWRDGVAPGASPGEPSPYLVTNEFIASSGRPGTVVLDEAGDGVRAPGSAQPDGWARARAVGTLAPAPGDLGRGEINSTTAM